MEKPKLERVAQEKSKASEQLKSYEREKLTTTYYEVKALCDLIRSYITILDFCDQKNLAIKGRMDFSKIRNPGAAADESNSDILKLTRLFNKANKEVKEVLTGEELVELDKLLEK